MASQEIDKSWDGWIQALSGSYVQVQDLMKQKKSEDAAKEYLNGFRQTVVKLYEQVASAPPQRFAKMGADAWSEWARGLYVKMREAEDIFKARKQGDPAKSLEALRIHFLTLHQKTGTAKSNDTIFAFYQQTMAKAPKAEELNKLAGELETIAPSIKARAQAEAYAKAKTEWKQVAAPILQDGKLKKDEVESLRQASEKFYSQFGIQFE